MFMGEYHHTIDDKGRLIVPSKLRDELGESFIITRGIDENIYVYTTKDWEVLVSKLKELPFTMKDARTFNRFMLSGATVCVFDKQGRVNIPSSLAEYASLKKECVIIGVNDRLEIWSRDAWDKNLRESLESLSDIAEHLFETNINI